MRNESHITTIKSMLNPNRCLSNPFARIVCTERISVADKDYSSNSIYRLLQYRTALLHMKELGFSNLSSEYLAEAVGTTSTQVRKDFSQFKIAGKKRGGYDLYDVINTIDCIFARDKHCNAIIVGAGNLGSALMRYKGADADRFSMIAAFDIDPAKYKNNASFPIYPMDRLSDIVKENNVEFAMICVPAIAAQGVLDCLVKAGIKGVLNFALCSLVHDSSRVFVKNVNIANELDMLAFFVNHQSSQTVEDNFTQQTGVYDGSMQLQI